MRNPIALGHDLVSLARKPNLSRGQNASCDSGAKCAPAALADGRQAACEEAYPPITPPSARVMATTEGRGGVLSLKSGQRVVRLSIVSEFSPGC